MNSGQRSAAGEDVGDDRGEGGEFGWITDDVDIGSNGACGAKDSLQQGASVEGDEGFVGTHARALAAGEDEGGHWAAGRHGRIIHWEWMPLKRGIDEGAASLCERCWRDAVCDDADAEPDETICSCSREREAGIA